MLHSWLLLFSHGVCLTLRDRWTVARLGPLPSIISRSLLRFMSIESVMLSNHLILYCPFSSCLESFPESRSFLMSRLFTSGSQSIGASASAWVLPMNIQGWFPLGLTGWISLLSPSPFAFSLSQHRGLFQWVSSSHQVAKVLELQFQQQSFQWIFRVDL